MYSKHNINNKISIKYLDQYDAVAVSEQESRKRRGCFYCSLQVFLERNKSSPQGSKSDISVNKFGIWCLALL